MPLTHRPTALKFTLIVLVGALASWPNVLLATVPSPKEATVRVSVGESLQEVQDILKFSRSPSTASNASEQPETQIRIQERGIWIFFGPDNRSLQFRFDAPFAGAIHGARIGDSIERIQSVLGTPLPLTAMPHLAGKSFLYHLENGITIRCDFDQNEMLQTIRLLGGAIEFTEPPAGKFPAASLHDPFAPIVTSEGKVTRLTIPGSLAATHNVDCVSLEGVDSAITPPDLYAAIPRCLAEDRFDEGAMLFALAGAEASFDAQRVTDKTAGQARQVMIMNTFNTLPMDTRQKFSDRFKAMMANPLALEALCAHVRNSPPPSYYPRYMILHGMKAFNGDPYENAIDANFDAKRAWVQIQRTYLNCPASL